MALINDTQLTALAEDIVPALPADPSEAQTTARENAVATTKSLCQKICQYIVDQIEIKGVTVGLDSGSRTLETYLAGAGDKGGALNATPYPVIGSVKTDKADTGTQSNDGKGLVS